jgi:hypothetical protein
MAATWKPAGIPGVKRIKVMHNITRTMAYDDEKGWFAVNKTWLASASLAHWSSFLRLDE